MAAHPNPESVDIPGDQEAEAAACHGRDTQDAGGQLQGAGVSSCPLCFLKKSLPISLQCAFGATAEKNDAVAHSLYIGLLVPSWSTFQTCSFICACTQQKLLWTVVESTGMSTQMLAPRWVRCHLSHMLDFWQGFSRCVCDA